MIILVVYPQKFDCKAINMAVTEEKIVTNITVMMPHNGKAAVRDGSQRQTFFFKWVRRDHNGEKQGRNQIGTAL